MLTKNCVIESSGDENENDFHFRENNEIRGELAGKRSFDTAYNWLLASPANTLLQEAESRLKSNQASEEVVKTSTSSLRESAATVTQAIIQVPSGGPEKMPLSRLSTSFRGSGGERQKIHLNHARRG